jgi:anti-sigma factor RsiW
MRCETSRRLLSRYQDQELGLLTRLRLERHLRGCDACRAELELDRRVWSLLGTAEVVSPPELPMLESRLLAERPAPLTWRARWLAPVAFASALVLSASAGVALGLAAANCRLPAAAITDAELVEFLGDEPAGLAPVGSLAHSAGAR